MKRGQTCCYVKKQKTGPKATVAWSPFRPLGTTAVETAAAAAATVRRQQQQAAVAVAERAAEAVTEPPASGGASAAAGKGCDRGSAAGSGGGADCGRGGRGGRASATRPSNTHKHEYQDDGQGEELPYSVGILANIMMEACRSPFFFFYCFHFCWGYVVFLCLLSWS